MFVCKNCKSVDKFELMFNPEYRGNCDFSYVYDKDGNLKMTVDGFTFVPDLAFMNSHAVCKHCGSLFKWDYAM